MTTDRESRLFEFANSKRPPTDEEEQIVTDMHAALGMNQVPIRLMHPPAVKTAPRWNRYVLAVAALLMVFALGRASFMALQSDPGGVPTDVPPVVLGLASQAPATPAEESCDFSGDVPIFSAANQPPLDGTIVIVTLDKQLKLVCADQETILAENVLVAIGTGTPGVLRAMTSDSVLLVNIVTKDLLAVPYGPDQSIETISINLWGPWAMLPSTDTNDAMSLYNLNTFGEIPIKAGDRRVKKDEIGGLAVTFDDQTLSVAISMPSSGDAVELDGIFIANTGGTTNFVEVDVPGNPRQLVISPDGSTLAMSSYQGDRNSGELRISVIESSSGTVLKTIEVGEFDRFIDLVWLNEGKTLLYSDQNALYKIEFPTLEPQIVFEGDQIQGLVLTEDSHTVAISHAEEAASGVFHPKTTIINLTSGNEILLDGHEMFAGSSMATERTTLLLVTSLEWDPKTDRTAYNAVTGEKLGSIDVPESDPNGFSYSSWGNDRNITVLAFSPDSIWNLIDSDGNADLVKVTPPPMEGESVTAVSVAVAPDGYMALETFEPYGNWILPPSSEEWIPVELAAPADSQGVIPSISFVPGLD